MLNLVLFILISLEIGRNYNEKVGKMCICIGPILRKVVLFFWDPKKIKKKWTSIDTVCMHRKDNPQWITFNWVEKNLKTLRNLEKLYVFWINWSKDYD